MTIILKEHVRSTVLTISVCDSNLIGKKFEEGKLCLNLSTSYYSGDESSIENILNILKKAKSATIVGTESVNAIKEEYPDSSITYIENIPIINIMKF